jgi:hypothetical protein
MAREYLAVFHRLAGLRSALPKLSLEVLNG